jgi:hypothetical protein
MNPTERWEIQGKFDDECGVEIIVQREDGAFVCDVEPLIDEWDDEQIARVRLIAAAPDLLEACKAKLAYCKKYEGCQDAALLEGEYCSDECAAIAAAIAKAEDHQ